MVRNGCVSVNLPASDKAYSRNECEDDFAGAHIGFA
jgi:hypothetical protein